jgi:hypothetical protein
MLSPPGPDAIEMLPKIRLEIKYTPNEKKSNLSAFSKAKENDASPRHKGE